MPLNLSGRNPNINQIKGKELTTPLLTALASINRTQPVVMVKVSSQGHSSKTGKASHVLRLQRCTPLYLFRPPSSRPPTSSPMVEGHKPPLASHPAEYQKMISEKGSVGTLRLTHRRKIYPWAPEKTLLLTHLGTLQSCLTHSQEGLFLCQCARFNFKWLRIDCQHHFAWLVGVLWQWNWSSIHLFPCSHPF